LELLDSNPSACTPSLQKPDFQSLWRFVFVTPHVHAKGHPIVKTHVVLLGPPGCGKGTQSKLLANVLGVPHYSTGQILRDGAAAGDPAALSVKAWIDAGGYAPDELMNEVVRARLDSPEAAKGFVLDGYPRTNAQAVSLDAMLTARGIETASRPKMSGPRLAVVRLRVDEALLIDRIKARASADAAAGRPVRTDDDPATFPARLDRYRAVTEPVVAYYARTGVLTYVNGMSSPETVHADIMDTLA
jgi:adenylate kinase